MKHIFISLSEQWNVICDDGDVKAHLLFRKRIQFSIYDWFIIQLMYFSFSHIKISPMNIKRKITKEINKKRQQRKTNRFGFIFAVWICVTYYFSIKKFKLMEICASSRVLSFSTEWNRL